MGNAQEELKKKDAELAKAEAEKAELEKQLADAEAITIAEQEELKKKDAELAKAEAEKAELEKQLADAKAAKGKIIATPAAIVRKKRTWVRVRLRIPGAHGYTRRAGEVIVIEGTKEDVNPKVYEFIEEIKDEKLVNELEAQKEAEAKVAEMRRRAKIRM